MFLTSNMVPAGSASKSTTGIVNSFNTAGVAPDPMTAASTNRGVKTTLSGTLIANTLKSMLTITGQPGSMSVCALYTSDATAQTLRLRVIVDGAYTAFDTTTASVSTMARGILAAGTTDTAATNVLIDGSPIHWKTSIEILIASSAAATDKLTLATKYMLEA